MFHAQGRVLTLGDEAMFVFRAEKTDHPDVYLLTGLMQENVMGSDPQLGTYVKPNVFTRVDNRFIEVTDDWSLRSLNDGDCVRLAQYLAALDDDLTIDYAIG